MWYTNSGTYVSTVGRVWSADPDATARRFGASAEKSKFRTPVYKVASTLAASASPPRSTQRPSPTQRRLLDFPTVPTLTPRPCLAIIRMSSLPQTPISKLTPRARGPITEANTPPSDLVMCRKQPGISIGRVCDKCDGKCPVCDSYVRPTTLVRICDECSFGNYQNKCVVCGGEGISDAFYCFECTRLEKDRDGCPKIINLGSSRTDVSRPFLSRSGVCAVADLAASCSCSTRKRRIARRITSTGVARVWAGVPFSLEELAFAYGSFDVGFAWLRHMAFENLAVSTVYKS